MATKLHDVTLDRPDQDGCYWEPAAVNFGANDRYPVDVIVFEDTSNKIGIGFQFKVPGDYVGTPKLILSWGAVATVGDVVWDVDAKAVAAGESLDPSTDDETATATDTVPGTVRLRKDSAITLSGTYAPGDLVVGKLSRDGADANDDLAAAVYVVPLSVQFQYSDV